jgi:SAM-dependent methyltransferase
LLFTNPQPELSSLENALDRKLGSEPQTLSTSMPMADDPASGPRLRETNCVWLAERTEGVACELGAEDEPGDSRLRGLFSAVQRRLALPGLADALGDESVDAVLIHGLPRNEATAPDEDFLRECRRVLRPGGYVVFCADYP